MSVEYVYIGFTVTEDSASFDVAYDILDENTDDIISRESEWNANDDIYLWDIDEKDPDSIRARVRDSLRSALYQALSWDGAMEKIGDSDRYYFHRGDFSNGDEPFDGFSDLCALLNVITLIDDLAERTGILGWGIITD